MVFLGHNIRPPAVDGIAGSNNLATRLARHRHSKQNSREHHQVQRPCILYSSNQQRKPPSSRLAVLTNSALQGVVEGPTSSHSVWATMDQAAFGAAELPVAHHPAGMLDTSIDECDVPASSTSQAATAATTSKAGSSQCSSTSLGPVATSSALPAELLRLADASAPVMLPPPHSVPPGSLDNRELDKLVGTLGRSKATWRRALVLSQWLQESGHVQDDRLCTTLIRVCSEHGQAVTALSVYEWMKAPAAVGGAGLAPTVYTYTAAMRAALSAGLLDRALQVWEDAQAEQCQMDCRLCITYIEVCSRKGLTDRALSMYHSMRSAPKGSKLAPTVHAYTAAMRAATEGGLWAEALDMWADMKAAGVAPTGHAFAAAMSACAAGSNWQQAVSLFEDMCRAGIKPDVVSCTALLSALASAGQCQRAEAVVQWMLTTGVRPNVRTYTALVTALGNARQWDRALEMLQLMQHSSWGGVTPNAYTYNALLKCLGECGEWLRAERLFSILEQQALQQAAATSSSSSRAAAAAANGPTAAAAATAGSTGGGRAAGLAAAATIAAVGGMSWPSTASQSPPSAAGGSSSSSSSSSINGHGSKNGGGPPCAVPLGCDGDAEVVPGVWGWQAAGTGRQSLVQQTPLYGLSELPGSSAAAAAAAAPAVPDVLSRGVASSSNGGGGSDGPGAFLNQAEGQSQEQQQSLWTSASQLHGLDLQLQHEATASQTGGHSSTAGSRSDSPAPDTAAAAAAAGASGPSSSSMQGVLPLQQQQLGAGSPAAAAVDSAAAAAGQVSVPPGVSSHAVAQQLAQLALQQHITATMDLQMLMHRQQAQALAASHMSQQQQQHNVRLAQPPQMPIRTQQQQQMLQQQHAGSMGAATTTTHNTSGSSSCSSSGSGAAGRSGSSVAGPSLINEVVVRSLMMAYEQAGKWQQCVGALARGAALGISPSGSMYNIAISAAGKAGQLALANALFTQSRTAGAADSATFETMVAVLGMAGEPARAEVVLRAMQAAGFMPGDHAFCGLIAGYALAGDAASAQRVRARIVRERGPGSVSVHVYNALLAAADRAGAFDKALELLRCMRREEVQPDALTQQLAADVGRRGAVQVEGQQLTAAALSGAMAAAGALLIRSGVF